MRKFALFILLYLQSKKLLITRNVTKQSYKTELNIVSSDLRSPVLLCWVMVRRLTNPSRMALTGF